MEEPETQGYQLYSNSQSHGGLMPLPPSLFKGQFLMWAIQSELNVVHASIQNIITAMLHIYNTIVPAHYFQPQNNLT